MSLDLLRSRHSVAVQSNPEKSVLKGVLVAVAEGSVQGRLKTS